MQGYKNRRFGPNWKTNEGIHGPPTSNDPVRWFFSYFFLNQNKISMKMICHMTYFGHIKIFDHSWPLSGHQWSVDQTQNLHHWILHIKKPIKNYRPMAPKSIWVDFEIFERKSKKRSKSMFPFEFCGGVWRNRLVRAGGVRQFWAHNLKKISKTFLTIPYMI